MVVTPEQVCMAVLAAKARFPAVKPITRSANPAHLFVSGAAGITGRIGAGRPKIRNLSSPVADRAGRNKLHERCADPP